MGSCKTERVRLHVKTCFILANRKKASIAPVNFGTPWAQGALMPENSVSLQDEAGVSMPVQTKISAYWPDGSVKWLLHTAILDTRKEYYMQKGEAAKAKEYISAIQAKDDSVTIKSGRIFCKIQKGKSLISSMTRRNTEQQPVSAQLTALIENRGGDNEFEINSIMKLTGITEKITLEESGPLRAVVKIEGKHEYIKRKAQIFPFIVRLYFYAGSDEIKMVHTFIFDADENKDYLKGLAFSFTCMLTVNCGNRHVGSLGCRDVYEAVQRCTPTGGFIRYMKNS